MEGGDRLVIARLRHRRRVEIEKFHGVVGVNALGARVVARGHIPARADFVVGDLRVAIAVIIVVAQRDVPRHLQRRRGINFLKRRLPLRIVRGRNAVLVKIIAHGNDELRVNVLRGNSHLRGDIQLVLLAVPPPIAEDEEVQPASPRIRREQAARQQRDDDRRLRGDKQSADELAARLFHKAGGQITPSIPHSKQKFL